MKSYISSKNKKFFTHRHPIDRNIIRYSFLFFFPPFSQSRETFGTVAYTYLPMCEKKKWRLTIGSVLQRGEKFLNIQYSLCILFYPRSRVCLSHCQQASLSFSLSLLPRFYRRLTRSIPTSVLFVHATVALRVYKSLSLTLMRTRRGRNRSIEAAR